MFTGSHDKDVIQQEAMKPARDKAHWTKQQKQRWKFQERAWVAKGCNTPPPLPDPWPYPFSPGKAATNSMQHVPTRERASRAGVWHATTLHGMPCMDYDSFSCFFMGSPQQTNSPSPASLTSTTFPHTSHL
jgi:hypothetical protein